MKRYKSEVDALHAPDALRASIAALPQTAAPRPRKPVRRYAALAAVLVVVLLAGIVAIPARMFSAQKSADYAAPMEMENVAAPAADYDMVDGASDNSYSYSEESYACADAKSAVGAVSSTSETAAAAYPEGRKLIRDAVLEMQTLDFDALCAELQTQTTQLGGYVQSTDSGSYFSGLRHCVLVLRIPAAKLDTFLQAAENAATVTSINTSLRDVTDEYIDIESRLTALETEQETLLSLMKKAEKLTDTLEIQDRLTDVRAELESYKGRMQALQNQIDYSTVTLNIDEVERVTPPESKSFSAQVRQNLSDNLYSIGQGFRSFALWLVSSLPYIGLWLVFIAVITLVIVRIVRRIRRR